MPIAAIRWNNSFNPASPVRWPVIFDYHMHCDFRLSHCDFRLSQAVFVACMSPGIIVTVCERCPEATAHRNTWNFANASKMVMHQIRAISGKTGCVSWLLTLWTQVGWKFMRETCTAKLSGGLWFSIITLWFSIITLWFPIITGSFRGLYEPGNHCNRMRKMPRGNCTQKHLKYCTGLWRCNTLELNSMSRVLSYGDVMFRHAPTRRAIAVGIFFTDLSGMLTDAALSACGDMHFSHTCSVPRTYGSAHASVASVLLPFMQNVIPCELYYYASVTTSFYLGHLMWWNLGYILAIVVHLTIAYTYTLECERVAQINMSDKIEVP